jgi:hypothetical protein
VNIDELARLAGTSCWMEQQLFAVLGGWSKSLAVPQAKALVASHSAQHAWHAQLWRDRIPAINGSDGYEFVDAAPAHERAIALLRNDHVSDGQRLAALYLVVVPSMVEGYHRHLDATDPVVDGSTIRVLNLIVADERVAVEAGEELVRSLTGKDEFEVAQYVAEMTAIMERSPR